MSTGRLALRPGRSGVIVGGKGLIAAAPIILGELPRLPGEVNDSC